MSIRAVMGGLARSGLLRFWGVVIVETFLGSAYVGGFSVGPFVFSMKYGGIIARFGGFH